MGVQYSRRDERSRLGQAYGTLGQQFGTFDALGYKKPEVVLAQARKFMGLAAGCNCDIVNDRFQQNRRTPLATAFVAQDLAQDLDDDPYDGYYDRVGPTTNDVLNSYLRGEIFLPYGIEMKTVTGYASYDRLIDVDLDFSPTVLAEARQKDDLY